MTPRPPFTLWELRRLADALEHRARACRTSARIYKNAKALRDAAAFVRLRRRVQEMIEGREEKR